MATDFELRFSDEPARPGILERLRSTFVAGELVEGDDAIVLRVDEDGADAAAARGESLIADALAGTDLDPSSVSLRPRP